MGPQMRVHWTVGAERCGRGPGEIGLLAAAASLYGRFSMALGFDGEPCAYKLAGERKSMRAGP